MRQHGDESANNGNNKNTVNVTTDDNVTTKQQHQ
jgi:hypothetical protein